MGRLVDSALAVAIDLDGTLIDTVPDLASSADLMLTSLGMTSLPEHKIAAMVGDGIDTLVQRAVHEASGRAPNLPLLEAAINRFRAFYAEHVFERSRVYPGVCEGLRRLQDKGLPLACITNKSRRFAAPLLEAAGIAAFFTELFCAEKPEERKPRPGLLLAACAAFRILPSRLLCIGDSTTDIMAARAAGCPVVAVDYGYNRGWSPPADVPDRIIGCLSQILE